MPFVVENGYRIFTDLEGQPLDSGYIFIGEDGLNPLTNPQTAYFDEALTIPAENIRTSGGYAVYRGSPATIYTLNDYSILVQDKNQQTVYYNPSVSALEVGPVSLDLSTLANGYLPIGFAAPDTGVTFPGFVAAGTENLSATLYPELYAQVASQDFLSDNGDGTFNVLNTGLDTGWVSNSSWQAATFTILHNLNQALSNLEISFEVSELGTDNTAIRPLDVAYDAASGADAVKGITYHGSNSNQFLVKTGTNGIDYIDTDGTRATLTTQSWFYRIKVKRKDMPYPAQIKAQVLQNGDALTTLMNETGWAANSDWTAATFTFIHSLNILSPFVNFWVSPDGTWENAFRVDLSTDQSAEKGLSMYIRDENTIEFQSGTNGILVTADGVTVTGTAGEDVTLAAQNWYYNIIVYKPQLITNVTTTTGTDAILGLDKVVVEYSSPNFLIKVGSKIEANGTVYTVQGSDVSLTAADGNLCFNESTGFFIDNVETPVYDPAKGGYYINTTDRVTRFYLTSSGNVTIPVNRTPGLSINETTGGLFQNYPESPITYTTGLMTFIENAGTATESQLFDALEPILENVMPFSEFGTDGIYPVKSVIGGAEYQFVIWGDADTILFSGVGAIVLTINRGSGATVSSGRTIIGHHKLNQIISLS
jgi:hypothetical protein